jgi:DNA (cytosine-5)-methyltransferase 1
VSRPRLLDLFCGAGGAAVGYHRAGFDVVGVDIAPQRNFPFLFVQGDALEFLAEHGHGFDAVHASPPCQHYSGMSNCRPGLAAEYPDLIGPTRDALIATGKPWVIENVPGSPLRKDLVLCGCMVGLDLWQPDHPRHTRPGSRAGHWKPGQIISISGHCAPIAEARRAMGIDWMNRHELAESIPPAFAEYVGVALLAAALDRGAAAG